MSPDLCFIPDTSQTDPDIFSSQSLGDTLADTGFSGAGSSYKEQDRTGLFFVQGHYCKLLDDPLFDFLQSIVVFIQDGLSFFQVNRRHFRSLPGKAGDKIQIIIEQAVFMAFLAFLLHTV